MFAELPMGWFDAGYELYGYNDRYLFVIRFAAKVAEYNGVVMQAGVTLFFVPFIFVAYATEQLILSPILLFSCLVYLGYRYYPLTKKSEKKEKTL